MATLTEGDAAITAVSVMVHIQKILDAACLMVEMLL